VLKPKVVGVEGAGWIGGFRNNTRIPNVRLERFGFAIMGVTTTCGMGEIRELKQRETRRWDSLPMMVLKK
jgi:hypothetical protein